MALTPLQQAVKAVQSGMDVKKAAQKYKVNINELANALNPKGGDKPVDFYESSSYNYTFPLKNGQKVKVAKIGVKKLASGRTVEIFADRYGNEYRQYRSANGKLIKKEYFEEQENGWTRIKNDFKAGKYGDAIFRALGVRNSEKEISAGAYNRYEKIMTLMEKDKEKCRNTRVKLMEEKMNKTKGILPHEILNEYKTLVLEKIQTIQGNTEEKQILEIELDTIQRIERDFTEPIAMKLHIDNGVNKDYSNKESYDNTPTIAEDIRSSINRIQRKNLYHNPKYRNRLKKFLNQEILETKQGIRARQQEVKELENELKTEKNPEIKKSIEHNIRDLNRVISYFERTSIGKAQNILSSLDKSEEKFIEETETICGELLFKKAMQQITIEK